MWPPGKTPPPFILVAYFPLLIFLQFNCFCSAMDRFLVCPQILSLTPQSLPVSDSPSPITVKIKLPEFKYFTKYEFEDEKNPNSAIRGIQNYSCNFEVRGKSVQEKVKQRKYVLNKIVNNIITVVCNSPVKSSLPKTSWEKHHSLTSDLTVHLRGYDFKACDEENVIMKTDFNFFDCSTYKTCESCTESEFPCGGYWKSCDSSLSGSSALLECQSQSEFACRETAGGTGTGSEGGQLLITSSSNCSQKLTLEPSKHHHDHDGDGSNRMRPWKILLISLAVIVTVLVVVVIILLIWIKKKRGNTTGGLYALTKEEVDEFKKGNPDGGRDAERNNGNIYENLYRSLPFNSSYELPSDRLVIDRKIRLGKGQFGLIHPGTLIGDPEKDESALVQVAVKTVGPNMDNMYFKALLSELKVMAFLGSHQNIVSLLGAQTAKIKRGEIYIALEYCAKGDLLNYLQQNRQHFHNVFASLCEADDGFEDSEGYLAPNTATGTVTYTKCAPTINDPGLITKRRLSSSGVEYHSVTNPTISALDLIEWSRQIADAMSFISSKNVIHGDIAARNILLTEGYVAKIGDFGLSRQLLNYGIYFKTSAIPLPWKWLAVECLDAMNFSVQSDVWAFGVTLWEIFSLGQTPYAAGNYCHNSQLQDWLVAGNRMTSPSFANPELYELMLLCWKEVPAERITFDKLSFELQNLLSHLVKTTK